MKNRKKGKKASQTSQIAVSSSPRGPVKVVRPYAPMRGVPGPGEVQAGGIMEAASNIRHLAEYWKDAEERWTADIASASERARMRARSVHALLNSGYMKNAVRAFGNHVVGSDGPVFHLRKECGLTKEERAAVEWAYWNWQEKTGDIKKLRLAVRSLMFYGESFERFIYDPYVLPTFLNIEQIEPQAVDYPFSVSDPDMIDGIRFDGIHPIEYFIEKTDINPVFNGHAEYEPVPADHILHFFVADLAAQKRGIPQIATVLRLQADTMIWEAHTLGAAEWAAKWGGFVHTTGNFLCDETEDAPGDAILAPNPGEAVFTPAGWSADQIRPEFPTSNFSDFSGSLQREIGAGIGVPFGIMGADTSAYSYSSWRGERQNYWTYIKEIQSDFRAEVCCRRARKWLECEASTWRERATGELCVRLMERFGGTDEIPITFQFPEPPSADPEKEAKAEDIQLKNGTLSRHKIIEAKGYDYEEILAEREQEAADEARLAKILGTPTEAEAAP